jgi:hypothetical protein
MQNSVGAFLPDRFFAFWRSSTSLLTTSNSILTQNYRFPGNSETSAAKRKSKNLKKISIPCRNGKVSLVFRSEGMILQDLKERKTLP